MFCQIMLHQMLLKLQNFVHQNFVHYTFFDIMNIQDVNSHKFDLKPSFILFSSIDEVFLVTKGISTVFR